jgi:hypothetical protein
MNEFFHTIVVVCIALGIGERTCRHIAIRRNKLERNRLSSTSRRRSTGPLRMVVSLEGVEYLMALIPTRATE